MIEIQPQSTKMGAVLSVLDDMQNTGVIEKYAIGGAFAAILHYEPISTIDLDIFFFLKDKNAGPILTLETIYDFAKKMVFCSITNL